MVGLRSANIVEKWTDVFPVLISEREPTQLTVFLSEFQQISVGARPAKQASVEAVGGLPKNVLDAFPFMADNADDGMARTKPRQKVVFKHGFPFHPHYKKKPA